MKSSSMYSNDEGVNNAVILALNASLRNQTSKDKVISRKNKYNNQKRLPAVMLTFSTKEKERKKERLLSHA